MAYDLASFNAAGRAAGRLQAQSDVEFGFSIPLIIEIIYGAFQMWSMCHANAADSDTSPKDIAKSVFVDDRPNRTNMTFINAKHYIRRSSHQHKIRPNAAQLDLMTEEALRELAIMPDQEVSMSYVTLSKGSP